MKKQILVKMRALCKLLNSCAINLILKMGQFQWRLYRSTSITQFSQKTQNYATDTSIFFRGKDNEVQTKEW